MTKQPSASLNFLFSTDPLDENEIFKAERAAFSWIVDESKVQVLQRMLLREREPQERVSLCILIVGLNSCRAEEGRYACLLADDDVLG